MQGPDSPSAPNSQLTVYALGCNLRAVDGILFPEGGAANVFRGALGYALRHVACRPECNGSASCPLRNTCSYAQLFEPHLAGGPSGLADPPRPFVLRVQSPARRVARGEEFGVQIHLFGRAARHWPAVARAFMHMGQEGLGIGRGRARLESVFDIISGKVLTSPEAQPTARVLPLRGGTSVSADEVEVEFLTPTELKHEGRIIAEPRFDVLAARLRDRISALATLYGEGSLDLDFKGLIAVAAQVQIVECKLKQHAAERLSSRTGQRHPLGGFTGTVRYKGKASPLIPLLEAGRWTGVGRQTVWGKGAYRFR